MRWATWSCDRSFQLPQMKPYHRCLQQNIRPNAKHASINKPEASSQADTHRSAVQFLSPQMSSSTRTNPQSSQTSNPLIKSKESSQADTQSPAAQSLLYPHAEQISLSLQEPGDTYMKHAMGLLRLPAVPNRQVPFKDTVDYVLYGEVLVPEVYFHITTSNPGETQAQPFHCTFAFEWIYSQRDILRLPLKLRDLLARSPALISSRVPTRKTLLIWTAHQLTTGGIGTDNIIHDIKLPLMALHGGSRLRTGQPESYNCDVQILNSATKKSKTCTISVHIDSMNIDQAVPLLPGHRRFEEHLEEFLTQEST